MSKLLAVSWNAFSMRFVYGESGKNGVLRVIQSGERSTLLTPGLSATSDAAKSEEATPGEASSSAATDPVPCLVALVKELKASKSRLLLCVNRAMVDSATFAVPPATDAELPTIVRNMASRKLSGITDDSVVDFIVFPETAEGHRSVNVMSLAATDQQSVERLADESGCARTSAVVVTHSLALFSEPLETDESSATLIISKGQKSAHLLVTHGRLPVMSRSLRLAPGMTGDDEAGHIAVEVSRTLLTAESVDGPEIEISHVVVIGSEMESAALVGALTDQLGVEVVRRSVRSLVEGEAGDASLSAYAPLVAALKLNALDQSPPVDFLHPKRPPKAIQQRNRILAAIAAAAMLIGGGWYYVHNQFVDATAENVLLKSRLRELDDLVKKTRSKRNLAKVLTAWENRRLNWLDELRDITIRTPSSPELVLQQFSGTATGSGYTVSFRGTSQSPNSIRKMEEQLRDSWHAPKTPGIREIKDGKKSVWSFQTTMPLKSRRKDEYVSHRPTGSNAAATAGLSKTHAKATAKTQIKRPAVKADTLPVGGTASPITTLSGDLQ